MASPRPSRLTCGTPSVIVRAFASFPETRIIFIFSLPTPPVPVQKIGDVIANQDNLRSLAQLARRLEDLQHLLFEALPPALAAASRVSNLKSGLLIIRSEERRVGKECRSRCL